MSQTRQAAIVRRVADSFRHATPPPAAVWFVSRPFVLGVACLLVLVPLLGLRDLGRLGPMSSAGVAIAGAFACSMVGITITAIVKGQVGGV